MLIERDDTVLHVVLDDQPGNAIGPATIEGLERVLDDVESDPTLRALLFSSTARLGFGIGADLPGIARALGSSEGSALQAWTTRAGRAFERLEALPVLTVGALRGVTFGGAFEWALCLDVLVAEKGTRFALPELRLGLIPGFGGYRRLCRRGGESLARELLLTGRTIGTRRAMERGLLSTVVPRGEGTDCALGFARQAAGIRRDAMTAARQLVQADPSRRQDVEAAVLKHRLQAPDTHELLTETLHRSDPWKHLPPSTT
jgi:enoyl-CoA hydratase/carnithine racemase